MSSPPRILVLPLVLFEQIIDLLYTEDYTAFLAFRAACRTCCQRSEKLLFNKLKLRGDFNQPGSLSYDLFGTQMFAAGGPEKRIAARLQDPQDRLASYIRRLVLAPTTDFECGQSAGLLGHMDRLQTLLWSTHLEMPSSLLAALHARPDVKLEVQISERHDRPLQHSLMSSPSLHKLDITILGMLFQDPHLSEFRTFKRLIMTTGSLKILTLRVSSYEKEKYAVSSDLASGELNLPFEPGDKFPALEELTLDCYDWYYLSAAHCEMWASCMDWSRLRSLDLGHATPQYLLPAITGRIPNLKRLRFGFWLNPHGPRANWNSSQDLTIVTDFVSSIEALQELTLFSWNDVECSQIRPAVFAHHGSSLRVLRHELDFRDAWKLEHFEDLRQHVPGIEELSVTIAMEEIKPYPGSRSDWPMSIQRVLCSLTSLRQLALRIHLRYDSFKFIPTERGWEKSAIDDGVARGVVTSLYNDFGADAAIEKVKVLFWAVSPGLTLWTYTAEKKWVSKENRYMVVVDRIVENEELDRRVRNEPFDPFG